MSDQVNPRRSFVKKAAVAAVSLGTLSACSPEEKETSKGPYINYNKTYRWKMTTTWPPNFPVVGEGCQLLADWVKKMSGGRMEITVYGGGELIPALEGFDAVSNGAVEMNHGAAYYWAGKVPAAQFFAAVPFGLNAQQMGAWIISGGGQKLWDELYAPFGLKPVICGNTGVQMGGWFNKEINTVEDLKGLKMRIPGLGGKVLAKAGGTPVLVSGGEIYTNLERGVIDATEWIGPYHDYKMGFHQVAKYYYYPGWHEPGPVLEMIMNQQKFNELPSDLQEILITACHRLNRWMMAEFDAKNGEYLTKMIKEEGVDVRAFPQIVLDKLRIHTKEALDELCAEDESSRKVYAALQAFKALTADWMSISEKMFYNSLS
ncbi:MAG: TRAP-type mannitol/chloroaromatic compound transport system substrate-binding protein [Cyclobacteriaceae bacterium]|jgi:TRAP-type mannitol/chloroaromatic compound transport system substrate-binding protein